MLDTQATARQHFEFAIKVKEIDQYSLMACEGSGDYIELFTEFIRNEVSSRETSTYQKVLNSAVRAYSAYMKRNIEEISIKSTSLSSKMLVRQAYPRAVFATNDRSSNTYRLFEIKPPFPIFEPELPYRVTVGSGDELAAGFLKNIEYFMARAGVYWNNLSTRLVSQLCWLLVKRIEHVDPGTSGVLVYRIDDQRARQLTLADVWGETTEPWSAIFLRTGLSEIPPENLYKIIQRAKLSELIKTFSG